jgi:thioredoxin-related protein
MKHFLIVGFLLLSLKGITQTDISVAPFRRFPTLPPLQLLLGDSTTKYTKENIPKRKPVLLMLFSPDCSHCQHTAEEMVQRREDLKNIHIIMATLHSITEMNAFAEKYGLKRMDNIVLGKDIYYFMPSFYSVKNLPYLAFYDQKGKLIQGFEGSMPLKKIIDTFK